MRKGKKKELTREKDGGWSESCLSGGVSFSFLQIKIPFHLTVILISKRKSLFFFLFFSGYFVDVTIGHWSFVRVCVHQHKLCDVQKTFTHFFWARQPDEKAAAECVVWIF